ncbi:MAG: SDR family oxidoreductase [Verrucomicrobia bacterium]|nr:SDR family oxidoreductase [Verrucomicrobiota bacterium]
MYSSTPQDILKNRDKTIVVTGAGQGIGAEIARSFVDRGCSVALIDYNRELGIEQEKNLGAAAKFFLCDLSDRVQVEQLANSLNLEYGAIDTIIHNARSPAREKEILANLENEWDLSVQVMLKHPILLNQLLMGSLKKSKNPSILFIGSTNGHFISQQPISYHVIKGALSQTVRYLAAEYAQHGVRVNLLNPGIVEVPGRTRRNPELFQKIVEAVIPLQRTVKASEIGSFCLFYASEEAKYLTGSSLDLDGGEHLKDHFHLMMNHITHTTCEMAK